MEYLSRIAALALAASPLVPADSNPLQRNVLREGNTETAYRGECVKGETPYFEETLLVRDLQTGKTTGFCVISNNSLTGGALCNSGSGPLQNLHKLQPANHDELWEKCVGETKDKK